MKSHSKTSLPNPQGYHLESTLAFPHLYVIVDDLGNTLQQYARTYELVVDEDTGEEVVKLDLNGKPVPIKDKEGKFVLQSVGDKLFSQKEHAKKELAKVIAASLKNK